MKEGGRKTYECGGDEVGLGLAHEVLAIDLDELALRVKAGRVAQGEEDTAGAPRELVAKGLSFEEQGSVQILSPEAWKGLTLSADSGAGSPPQ